MSADGLLVVLSPGPGSVPPTTPVAGVPLERRIALAASRAGFAGVVLGSGGAALASALNGRAVPGGRRVVVLAGNVVPQAEWLRTLLTMPIERETLYADAPTVAVVETDDLSAVQKIVGRSTTAAEATKALRDHFRPVDDVIVPEGRRILDSLRDVPDAERWLLRSLIKANEGFMSRHVERRVSLAITRRLWATGVTPNMMTLVSVGVGLLAAPFFLSSAGNYQLTGALLFLAHSVLDGCDGELARLKFAESRAGAVLDFWGDNAVHVAIFSCIAAGWSLAIHAAWPLAVGAVSVAGTLATATTLASRIQRDTRPVDSRSATGRLVARLANRDFIYLVVALSAFGKASWFLVLSAIGAPLFLMTLLRVRRAGTPAPR